MNRKLFLICNALLFCLFTSCSAYRSSNELTNDAVTGAAIGGGTGAVVGAIISNGDILASAGLGAAIGAGTLAVSRYAYRKHQENKLIDYNNEVIKDNYYQILDNEERLEECREKLDSDSNLVEPTDIVNRYFEG